MYLLKFYFLYSEYTKGLAMMSIHRCNIHADVEEVLRMKLVDDHEERIMFCKVKIKQRNCNLKVKYEFENEK